MSQLFDLDADEFIGPMGMLSHWNLFCFVRRFWNQTLTFVRKYGTTKVQSTMFSLFHEILYTKRQVIRRSEKFAPVSDVASTKKWGRGNLFLPVSNKSYNIVYIHGTTLYIKNSTDLRQSQEGSEHVWGPNPPIPPWRLHWRPFPHNCSSTPYSLKRVNAEGAPP